MMSFMMSEGGSHCLMKEPPSFNRKMCSLLPQREFPWDDEDCCSLAVLGAGVAMGFFYVWILGRKSPGSTSCSVPWRAVW